jgi:glutamate 5-kinase
VLVDAGAAAAVGERQRSLLAPGVTEVIGDFEAGDVVEVIGPDGLVARGVVAYHSDELVELLTETANRSQLRPVVHRDDLAVVRDLGGRARGR